MTTKTHYPVSLRIRADVLDDIHFRRGDMPLSRWIHNAIEMMLLVEDGAEFPPKTTQETTRELQKRLEAVEARLSELEKGKSRPPKEKTVLTIRQPIEDIDPPELEPVDGVVSHKDYRDEIDSLVMSMTESGHSLQMVADYLNGLGWLTQKGSTWTRNSVGAITRRLKANIR